MFMQKRIKSLFRHFFFLLSLKKKCTTRSEDAFSTLMEYHPRSIPTFTQHNTVNAIYDVMIIIPVYNVEAYLEECIRSVLHQKTQYSYQAVFVNDGSTDTSADILARLVPSPHVVIHKENGGLSSARNAALKSISGRYVMFLDSDDYLSESAVETLVRTADSCNADIAEGGHWTFCKETLLMQNGHGPEQKIVSHNDLFGYAWGKVIRSDCLKNFSFPDGFIFEDTVMSTLLHPLCRCAVVPDMVYYYRENPHSITQISKKRKESIDTFWMMKFCLEERLARGDTLEQIDYARYLIAVRRNWLRTKALPDRIQQSLFALTCDLFSRNLPFQYSGSDTCLQMLDHTIRARSSCAFFFLMARWELF